MSTARDYLAAVQQRADAATDGPWTFQHWGQQNQNGDYAESILFDGDGETSTYGLADRDGEFIAAARTDVPRLVAALEAVLDMDPIDVALGGLDAVVDVVTDALTPKENDS